MDWFYWAERLQMLNRQRAELDQTFLFVPVKYVQNASEDVFS